MTATLPSSSQKNWLLPFFTIWTGQAFSLLGSQLVSFALVWWLTQTANSAIVLTTATIMGIVPQVLIAPFAGALVDRWNRRIVMMVADSLIALFTLGLAVLFLTGVAQIWHIYLLMFLRSTAGGFHWPAMQASTSLMVPKEHLSRIQGMNQVLQGAMSIFAAPLGALLLAWLPMQGILSIDVVTALMAVVPLLWVVIPQPAQETLATGSGVSIFWKDFVAGLRYALGWRGLVLIGLMATFVNLLLNPAFALLPILITRHFFVGIASDVQAMRFATLEAATGVGVIVGGLLLGIWGGFRRRIYTSMLGLLMIGVGSLAVGILPPGGYTLAIGLMFLLGVANPITNGPLFAVLQATVAPDMQGRVFTLISSVAAAMSPLGLIIAGPVAEYLGPQSWFVIGGIVTGLMGITGFFIPAIVNIENGSNAATHPATLPDSGALAPSPVDGD